MKIEYSPKFKKLYKQLPKEIRLITKEKIDLFSKNPFDTRLKTHKLAGILRNYWAFSVDYRHRIIFSFTDEGVARLYVIGDHSIYQ